MPTALLPASDKVAAPPPPLLSPPPSPRAHAAPRSPQQVVGLLILLVGTAFTYLWNLTASGYANSFYAAAVQAGTKSWKALFFGSLDSSNFITVDKPPASLWVMELFGRVLGFSSFSMLLPEVLMGVVSVAVAYAAVRRWHGHLAAMLTGLVLATTPVAALMFRFNNPDALLVLLMTVGAYATVRAVEVASLRWIGLAGVATGFAFLTKMGEALLVVPAFALAYLIAAPTTRRRRLLHLLAAGAALVTSAGWWILIVTLWPTASRPMIDGSPTNSMWNLILEYNGLGRVVSSTGGPGGNFSGTAGALRLFNDLMGGQASWLLPSALAVLAGGLWITRRAPRLDRGRAALVLWGGWLVVAGAVFSLGQGVIHTYYTVALAPPIATLVGIGGATLWHERRRLGARLAAAALVTLNAGWSFALLDRTPTWHPWLRFSVLAAGGMAAVTCLASALWGDRDAGRVQTRLGRSLATIIVASTAVASLSGPFAYLLKTVSTAQTGSVPSAGPALATATGFGGGAPGGSAPSGSAPSGVSGRLPGASGGSALPSQGFGPGGPRGAGWPGSGAARPAVGARPGGGGGAATSTVSPALVKVLEANAGSYTWVAATDGSQSAASIELATGGDAVMAIGGFNNQGGNLSLATFEHDVAAGDIHYFLLSGGGRGGPGGGSATSAITTWVESHFTAETVGGQTIYNLTQPKMLP